MRLQLRTTLVLLAVLLLGLPAAARASGQDVIRDCAQDGKLDKSYSQKELEDAEQNLPSDIDEYTDCRQVIRAAMSGGSGNPGGPGPANAIITASGAVAGSQNDVNALTAVQQRSEKGKRPHSIALAGRTITPGNAGLGGVLGGLAGSNGMPPSLIAAIAALLILAVVTAYLGAREKFPLIQRVALRILGR
jgi:phage shock protein PspC (stress-responsive transcriptional regulator)